MNIWKEAEHINKKYNEHFLKTGPSFRDTMKGQLEKKDQVRVFAVVPDKAGFRLVVSEANSTGYYKTNSIFMEKYSFEEASDIAEQLTKEIFGVEGEFYDRIHLQALGVRG